MNLPNKLSLIRICLIPVFIAVFYITAIPYNYCISAGIFAIASFTDFLDGYIARKYNLVTDLGKFLDPIADKVLVSTALILMLTVDAMLPFYTAIFVAIIIARELIISGFRIIAAGKGLVLAADKLGKIKTVFQLISIIVLLVSTTFDLPFIFGSYNILSIIGLGLFAVATLFTIISGISYVVKNRKVLSNEDQTDKV